MPSSCITTMNCSENADGSKKLSRCLGKRLKPSEVILPYVPKNSGLCHCNALNPYLYEGEMAESTEGIQVHNLQLHNMSDVYPTGIKDLLFHLSVSLCSLIWEEWQKDGIVLIQSGDFTMTAYRCHACQVGDPHLLGRAPLMHPGRRQLYYSSVWKLISAWILQLSSPCRSGVREPSFSQ